MGEDSGASSGALCGDERGGLHAVMAGEGPAGRSIGGVRTLYPGGTEMADNGDGAEDDAAAT